MHEPKTWALPYIDQPLDFWREATALTGNKALIYCPMPDSPIGTGRPPQPDRFLRDFLRSDIAAKSVLLNPIVLPYPADAAAAPIIEALRRLRGECGVSEAVVADALLARRLREALPDIRLAASTLADISTPAQVFMLDGLFDVITPSTRILRNLAALQRLRAAFSGALRLMVNECCLPGCPFRTQHFYEMNSGLAHPESLCAELLEQMPWLRLTGAWVLPQHLRFFNGLYDEIKLAGRVTLADPYKYLQVLRAYVQGEPLMPHEIGGGPASPLGPMRVDDGFYAYTLHCGQECSQCLYCKQAFC